MGFCVLSLGLHPNEQAKSTLLVLSVSKYEVKVAFPTGSDTHTYIYTLATEFHTERHTLCG